MPSVIFDKNTKKIGRAYINVSAHSRSVSPLYDVRNFEPHCIAGFSRQTLEQYKEIIDEALKIGEECQRFLDGEGPNTSWP